MPAKLRRGIGRRPAMDLENFIPEVHDPLVRYTSAGVDAALIAPVEREGRLRDLNQQGRLRRVGVTIVAVCTGRDDDIGPWLGLVVERHGILPAHRPTGSERGT